MPIMNIILNLKLRNDVKMETLKQKTSNMEFLLISRLRLQQYEQTEIQKGLG